MSIEISIETAAPKIRETAEVHNYLSFNDFILGALQRGVVDPINAGRLLAFYDGPQLTDSVSKGLYNLTEDHDGEPVPDRIVSPLLRTMEDFKDMEEVYAQPAPAGSWLKRHVYLDEVTKKVIVDTMPHAETVFDPQSLNIFGLQDYEILEKPDNARRLKGSAMAHRFALGLSAYDTKNNIFAISSVHRHFALMRNINTFKPITN